MRTRQIRLLIEEGKQLEKKKGFARNALINLASMNGRQVTELEIDEVIEFIIQYVEHAPALIELIEHSAASAGISQDIRPILEAVEDYFLAADDLIPDHLGLLGLMDDAYLAHSLIQEIAERYKARLGSKLLPADMSDTNALFRNLVDEPYASMLDDRVRATLDGPSIKPQMQMEEFMQLLEQINIALAPDPIWGEDNPARIASARLRVMGLV